MFTVLNKSSKLGISLVELPLSLSWVDPSTVKLGVTDPQYFGLNDQPKSVLSGVVDYVSASTAEVIHEIYPDKWKSDAREVKFDKVHYAVVHDKTICSIVTELSENLVEFFTYISDSSTYAGDIKSVTMLGEGTKARLSWIDTRGNISTFYPSLPKYYLSITHVDMTTREVSEVYEGNLIGKKTGPFDTDYYENAQLRQPILDMSKVDSQSTLGDVNLALSYVGNANKFNEAKWNDLFENTISKHSSISTSIKDWWASRFVSYESSRDKLILDNVPSVIIPAFYSSDVTLYHLVKNTNELIVEVLAHLQDETPSQVIIEYVMSLIKYLYKVLKTHESTDFQKYLNALPR